MQKIFIDPVNIDFNLIKQAADTLLQGGIVAIPTETVYGLAVIADDLNSVQKLYKLKERPAEKPFTIALDSPESALEKYFIVLPPYGCRMVEKFWPGPFTLIYYDKQDNVIGIRVPAHPVAKEILKRVGKAVFLPSANKIGRPEAVSALEIEAVFSDQQIDLIVDSGKSMYGQSSTVVDMTYLPFGTMREGVIPEQELIYAFIQKRIMFVCTGNTCRSPMAQFLLMKYIEENKPYLMTRYQIISRGIAAMRSSFISASVIGLLQKKENMDARGAVSQKLTRWDILTADIIVAMEDAHRDYILKLEPTAEGRVFTLGKFLPEEFDKDIPDPIGGDMKTYEETYDLVRQGVWELGDWL